MSYNTSLFYNLSELFDDDLRIIAHIIALKEKKDVKVIYKDLEFGRYKDNYLDILKEVVEGIKKNPLQTYTNTIKAIISKDEIFKRDDFENIEAYSVFKTKYNKKKKYDFGLFNKQAQEEKWLD